jgi:hypothetical protein
MLNKLYFGKYCEHKIIAELIKREFEVFLPVVDDRGIDILIRKNNKVIDIQVKGRQPRDIFNIKKFTPRDNYFFILVPSDKKIYIIPSLKIHEWLNGRTKFSLSIRRRVKFLNKYDLLGI